MKIESATRLGDGSVHMEASAAKANLHLFALPPAHLPESPWRMVGQSYWLTYDEDGYLLRIEGRDRPSVKKAIREAVPGRCVYPWHMDACVDWCSLRDRKEHCGICTVNPEWYYVDGGPPARQPYQNPNAREVKNMHVDTEAE